MAGAPEGNTNAAKLTTPELRKEAYDAYCTWLARGKTKRSFSFVKGDIMCTYRAIEEYIKNFPIELDPVKKEVAFAQGYAHWEGVVDGSADGSNKDACTPSLNMLMRNKYSWDKEEKAQENSPKEFDTQLDIVKPPKTE